MTEQLISFEVAKLAKEAGFDWECLDHYEGSELRFPYYDYGNPWGNYNNFIPGSYSAPTQSLLAKWLRDVHNTHIKISCNLGDWYFEILGHFNTNRYSEVEYLTYEAALEEGLKEGLRGLLSRGN
jgi:hypothetical protein